MAYTEQEHQDQHDSMILAVPDCSFCDREVYRRSHRCMGEGASAIPIPVPEEQEG